MVELIETIDAIGNTHGFGRVDMIENRLVGIKSREVYEVAGSLALITAHRELEDLVLTRDLLHFKQTIESKLADMIYEGQWFDPLTEACKAFLFQSQERVTGDVRLKFFKGSCVADGRQSDFSLYSYKLATYTTEDEFSHEAAAGFIQLWGLPIEVWARVGKEHHMMKELEWRTRPRPSDGGREPRITGGAGGRRRAAARSAPVRRALDAGHATVERRTQQTPDAGAADDGRALGPLRRRARARVRGAEQLAGARLAPVARGHRGLGGARPGAAGRRRARARPSSRPSRTASPPSAARSRPAPSCRPTPTRTCTWPSSAG